jgi:hypothetical protein
MPKKEKTKQTHSKACILSLRIATEISTVNKGVVDPTSATMTKGKYLTA